MSLDNAQESLDFLANHQEATHSCGAEQRVADSMAWKWQPTGCQLHAFDADHLNNVLDGKRHIHFVGDSLNDDMAASLKALGIKTVTAVRMDYLGQDPEGSSSPEGIYESWKDILDNQLKYDSKRGDIIVFNVGAHWNKPADKTALLMKQIAQEVSKLVPGNIIFRTTVMGHDGCENFRGPLDHLKADQREGFANKYNWMTFDETNQAVITAFSESMGDRFHVLDVSMFEMRPDGHVQGKEGKTGNDCLHYCVPGPIDTWNHLLYHQLLEGDMLQ